MRQRRKLWSVATTILVILILFVACETEPSDSDDGGPEDVNAKSICNQFVKGRLDNPLSADFKGFAGMGGDATKLPGPTPRWTVTSYVDSKTDFGITKRLAFECTVEHVGGDRWRLIGLDLTDLGVK